MHIPDAYLSPQTQGCMFAVMAPLWAYAGSRTKHDLTARQTPLLSIGAAFCFAVQMFNVPAVGGTTAHALGAGLLAILVGPWAALLGMSLTLVIQALLFGDGGVLSLGANCWDMGVVAPFLSFAIYRLLAAGSAGGSTRQIVAAGVGAYVGTVAAAFSAGLLLGLQPIVAHDAAGRALYCPFGLGVTVPAMVMSHLLVAGPAEAVITIAAMAYLWRSFPALVKPRTRTRPGQSLRLARGLLWVLLLTPLGLLAAGSAFGEWDIAALKKLAGFLPAGTAQSQPIVKPVLPEYGFAGMADKPWQVLGYLISALLGSLLVAIFARTLLRGRRVEPVPAGPRDQGADSIPTWISKPNPAMSSLQREGNPWLRHTLERVHRATERSIGFEEIARSRGLLQGVAPLAKTFGFGCALLAIAVTQNPWLLLALLLGAFWLAQVSLMPLAPFAERVAGATVFFGLAIAAPVSLAAVTAGPTAIRIAGVALSRPGLLEAALILLRLAAGISMALIWHSTTRWNDLLGSLRKLSLPEFALSAATLTYRYLFVSVATLSDMVEARIAREVGGSSRSQARAYAGTGAAILFAKSMALSEQVHLAMVSRTVAGLGGSAPIIRLRNWDWVAIAVGFILLGLSIWLRMRHAV